MCINPETCNLQVRTCCQAEMLVLQDILTISIHRQVDKWEEYNIYNKYYLNIIKEFHVARVSGAENNSE